LEDSIDRLLRWVEACDYKGYEPADGNASPLHALTCGNAFLQRILQQLVLRSPINIRPLLGIRPMESPQARGYMASGYILLYQLTGRQHFRDRAAVCLDWLERNKSPGYREYSWGNNFSYATRSGKLPRREPIIVWTVFNGFAFLDAWEALQDSKYLEVALSVRDWILRLPREQTSRGDCLSYHAFKQTSIHNSNMLGAAMLARTARLTGDRRGLEMAADAMRYSCTRQLPTGGWLYGEAANHEWIDNFHTGYNLDALKCYMECTGDNRFADNLDRGYRFFKDHFFDSEGRARYYHNKTYPVDIQCAAQAIDTLAGFAEKDPAALSLALKIAGWTIHNMQDRAGYFYYRHLGWTRVTTPLMHWGQGTMFKALAHLLSKMKNRAEVHADSLVDPIHAVS
jgi:rhamnogalacturonyl hydrolase YesR